MVTCTVSPFASVVVASGCSSMVAPRRSSSSFEAGCGGWLLNMNPKRPSVVGLLVTRSIPRSSAPWGGMGAGSAAAAGAIQGPLTADPSEALAAVPSETAAVPFRKRRRLKPRARFSDIFSPDSSVGLVFPSWRKAKHSESGAGLSSLSKQAWCGQEPPASVAPAQRRIHLKGGRGSN